MVIEDSPNENKTFNAMLKKVSQGYIFLEQLLNKISKPFGIFNEKGKYITSNSSIMPWKISG